MRNSSGRWPSQYRSRRASVSTFFIPSFIIPTGEFSSIINRSYFKPVRILGCGGSGVSKSFRVKIFLNNQFLPRPRIRVDVLPREQSSDNEVVLLKELRNVVVEHNDVTRFPAFREMGRSQNWGYGPFLAPKTAPARVS